MPTPRTLEFNVMAAEPPSTPEPSHSSSPSPLGDSEGTGATPRVKLGGRRGEPGTGCKACRTAKRLREAFSPPPMQDAASLLVPLGRPGQRYTLNSLVAYKAALHDLRVRARISIKEEEHTFTKAASVTSAPHISPTPPSSTPDFRRPVVPSGTDAPSWHQSAVSLACNAASPQGHRSPLFNLATLSGLF